MPTPEQNSDRSGASANAPSRRIVPVDRSLRGALLLTATVVLALVVCVMLSEFAPLVGLISGLIAAPLVLLGRFAIRHLVPSAEDVLVEDRRSPVLILRSFADEDLRLPAALRTSIFMPLPRVEDALRHPLSAFGPVVALGLPGELPQTGAARFSFSHEDWTSQVSALLRTARLVVVIAHAVSPGLLWELKEILAHVRPDRVLVCLGMFGDARGVLYDDFRRATDGCFWQPLPQEIGQFLFVTFDSKGSPNLVGTPGKGIGWFSDPLVAALKSIDPDYHEPRHGLVFRVVMILFWFLLLALGALILLD